MPRFYFDTFNGSLWVGDPEGIECPDVEAAMELAKVAMSDMAHDELPGGEGLTIMVPSEIRPVKPLRRPSSTYARSMFGGAPAPRLRRASPPIPAGSGREAQLTLFLSYRGHERGVHG